MSPRGRLNVLCSVRGKKELRGNEANEELKREREKKTDKDLSIKEKHRAGGSLIL